MPAYLGTNSSHVKLSAKWLSKKWGGFWRAGLRAESSESIANGRNAVMLFLSVRRRFWRAARGEEVRKLWQKYRYM